MIRCQDCKKSISDKAASCPKCGCPITREFIEKYRIEEAWEKKLIWCIVGILVIIFIIIANTSENKTVQAMSPSEIRNDKIKNIFSYLGGSNKKLIDLVKSNMNDPSSFQHVETKYKFLESKEGFEGRHEILIVTMKFRQKNIFGAIVLNEVRAILSLEGEVLYVDET